MVEPLAWTRSQEAFVPNGSKSGFRTVAQKGKKDISEDGIDAEVHGFANSMVEPIAWTRSPNAFVPNGSNSGYRLNEKRIEKKDIANKEVRPDVYVNVHKMVNPTAHWRSDKAPKYTYEKWWGEDGAPPMQELEKPKCPEELESEPDGAALKAFKIMKEEKAREAKLEAKRDAAMEKSIAAAEEEQKKIDDEEKAKKEAAAEAKADAKKEASAADEKKDEEAPKEDAAPKEEPKAAEKTATATATPVAAPVVAQKKQSLASQSAPGKIVKLMTGDLIFDRQNNLWRHEPVYIQQDSE